MSMAQATRDPGVQTPLRRFVADFAESRVAMAGLAVFALVLGAALLAPLLSPQNPYDLNQLDIMDGRQPPMTKSIAWPKPSHRQWRDAAPPHGSSSTQSAPTRGPERASTLPTHPKRPRWAQSYRWAEAPSPSEKQSRAPWSRQSK